MSSHRWGGVGSGMALSIRTDWQGSALKAQLQIPLEEVGAASPSSPSLGLAVDEHTGGHSHNPEGELPGTCWALPSVSGNSLGGHGNDCEGFGLHATGHKKLAIKKLIFKQVKLIRLAQDKQDRGLEGSCQEMEGGLLSALTRGRGSSAPRDGRAGVPPYPHGPSNLTCMVRGQQGLLGDHETGKPVSVLAA